MKRVRAGLHCWLASVALLQMLAFVSPANARSLPVVKPALACADLAQTDVLPLSDAPARIVSARLVSDDVVAPYCEVRGYVAPQVNFELRLPTQNWQQRFLFSGCGGFCGRVSFRLRAAEGCAALENNEMAIVATDMGHEAADGNGDTVWGANNRQGKIDYGYRAVHVVTVAAKAILTRFYGQAPAYSYFNGCSDGGREGMMEVQRYPHDFDGVVAGASVIDDTLNNTIYHVWNARQLHATDGSILFSANDLQTLHRAVLAACDDVGDGVRDGVVGNPEACRFDPASIECRASLTTGCLSAAQVEAARRLYSGPVDRSDKPLYFGRPFGSELNWGVFSDSAMALSFTRYLASDGIWDIAADHFDTDPASIARFNQLAEIYNATNPNIDAFRRAGGKLIMWHGWADPGVPPMSSVSYYRALHERYGADTDAFVRLFMLPGVGHCQGGDGPDRINAVDAITAWVEDGKAPVSIVAMRKVFGRMVQSRPVFAYPATARYAGTGDPMTAGPFRRDPR